VAQAFNQETLICHTSMRLQEVILRVLGRFQPLELRFTACPPQRIFYRGNNEMD
jgi:hypothetical protein